MRAVLEYVERPEPRTLPEVKGTLRRHMAEISALRVALETYSQRELDF